MEAVIDPYTASMAGRIVVDAVGSRIAIDLSALDAEDAVALQEAWADATLPGAEDVPAVAATVVVEPGDRAEMLSDVSQRVTLAAIEAGRGRAWMLHAAGVAGPDGAVVVLVGESGRGKTTAARALGATLGYVSDETIAIESDGRVRAYRKPLSVITGAAAHKRQLPPSAIGLRGLPEAPLRVAAVVLLNRDPEHAGEPLLEVADLGDALPDLVSQTSFLHDQPAPLRFIAALAAATGGIRRLTYAEAETLAPIVEALAAGVPASIGGVPHGHVPAAPRAARHAAADPSAPRFRRTDAADTVALADPDRLAVLTVDLGGLGAVTVLAGLAPAIWRTAEGAALPELVDAALAAYGTPQGVSAHHAVLAAVGELMDGGLVHSDEPAIVRRADAAWVDSGDRVVALALSPEADGRIAQPRALTGAGALVWDWLEAPVTLTQLTARAVETAGPDAADEVPGQIRDFVAELITARLAEYRHAAARVLRP